MEFLTAKKGTPHFTSEQFRTIITAIAGSESYITGLYERLAPELSVNNVIKISAGCLVHHGGVFLVKQGTYDEVSYQNGTQGMKRIDLIVVRYTKNPDTGIESGEWVVIRGTENETLPVAPEYTAGDMQASDLIDECPVFEVEFDGINVVEIRTLLEVTPNIDELMKQAAEMTAKINAVPGIEYGVLTGVTVPATSYKEYTVTFKNSFSVAPSVVATPKGNYNIICQVKSTTKTGFTLNVRTVDDAERTDRDFSWVAIGKR